jgi:septum formation protein
MYGHRRFLLCVPGVVVHRSSEEGPDVADLILASGSEARARILRQAGLKVIPVSPMVDEQLIRASLLAEGATPRDLADALAEAKAVKVSRRFPDTKVIGADQVLALGQEIFHKPSSPEEAVRQLTALSGREHVLLSAVVVCSGGRPLWRHVGEARLTLHNLTQTEISAYVARTWQHIRNAVGCYLIEEDGIRLMAGIEGDIFTIQGLPLLELLTWLRIRGDITA